MQLQVPPRELTVKAAFHTPTEISESPRQSFGHLGHTQINILDGREDSASQGMAGSDTQCHYCKSNSKNK